jgi:hypothetical protein
VLVAIVLAGCGGGDKPAEPKADKHGEGGGEEAELQRAVRGVRPADLAAFYQVATATGSLRRWAAGTRFGNTGSAVRRSELHGALARLRKVRPVDPELRRVRRDALAALGAAAKVAVPTRAEARRGLAQAERLAGTIHRVVREDPRFSALMPD